MKPQGAGLRRLRYSGWCAPGLLLSEEVSGDCLGAFSPSQDLRAEQADGVRLGSAYARTPAALHQRCPATLKTGWSGRHITAICSIAPKDEPADYSTFYSTFRRRNSRASASATDDEARPKDGGDTTLLAVAGVVVDGG